MRFIPTASLLLSICTTCVTVVSVFGRVQVSKDGIHRLIAEGDDNPFLQKNVTNGTTFIPIGNTTVGGNNTTVVDDTGDSESDTDTDTGDDSVTDDDGNVFSWGTPGLTVSPLVNWPVDQCISNLTWIMDDIILKEQLEDKTYVLCPNTIYEIGVDDSGTCCKPNTHHPFVIRSYSTFMCGLDGSATNNCIISGGNFQIMSNQHDFPGEPANGIKFSGLTFEKSVAFSILLANEGNFLFNDCIFRDVAGMGNIGMVFNPLPYVNERRYLLGSSDIDENNPFVKLYNYATRLPVSSSSSSSSSSVNSHSAREMVTSSTNVIAQTRRCVLTLTKCVFTNITLGSETTYAQPYVIYAEPTFHDLIITDSIFINNNFLFPDDVIEGFAIKLETENTIKLENNCFINNKFFGDGVVVLNETVVESLSNNYVTTSGDVTTATTRLLDPTASATTTGSIDPNLICQFIYNKGNSSCTPPDASTCPLLNTPTTNTNDTAVTPEQNNTTGTPSSPAGSSATITTSTTTLFYSSVFALFVVLVTAM